MEAEVEGAGSIDEQLGSPGSTFEKGWLAGIVLGLVAIVVMVRRKANRQRGNEAPAVGPAGQQPSVPA